MEFDRDERRLADAAARPEHRHRQRARARRDAAAGGGQHLRDRPDDARDRGARAALRQALRRRRRRRALVPRALRPRARHGGDRDRRRHALERGPRLRAAAHHPARRPARQPARPRGAVPGRAARGRDRVARPTAIPALAEHRDDVRRLLEAEEDALLADARDRLAPPRRADAARRGSRARRACTRATSSSCTTRTASPSS